MARLIPKISVEEISLKPERDVARALIEQLPGDCIVYHSYPWLRSDRNDKGGKSKLSEGEADFVIVDPQHGILVLEVKGGEIEYDAANHTWKRVVGSRRKEIRDPFEQARRNLHHLKDEIARVSFFGQKSLPFAFGYAVIFPDCVYQGELPPGAEASIVLSEKNLVKLGESIKNALRKWDRRSKYPRLEQSDLDGIQKGLSPSFRLMPVLYRRIQEQEEHLVRLTDDQMRLLEFLGAQTRAAINGVAGSGKTLLARCQAQRFADAGKKTLFVCYNKALAQWIKDTIPEEYLELITVRHFHGLCRDWCVENGVPFEVSYGDDADTFWRDEAPELLIKALEVGGERFDAVVVDEGQDFHPLWWMALSEIHNVPETGPMYVFYDPAQNLFVEDGTLPDLGEPYNLPTNCRNTRNIATLCGNIQRVPILTRPESPPGAECKIEVLTNEDKQRKQCEKYLKEWIGQGKLELSQVAILSPNSRSRSSLQGLRKVANWTLTEDFDKWRAGEAILFSTIRAFKGLEADAVVMIDVPEPGSINHFTQNDFYVAASRAKHLLVILANNEMVPEVVAGELKGSYE